MLIFHTKTRNNMILVSCEKKSWHVNHQSIVPHPCGYRLISAKLPSNKFRRQPSLSRLAIDIIHAMQLKKFLFLATAAILNGGQGCRTPFWRGATLGPSQPNNLVQQFQKRRSKYESLWRTTDARWTKKHSHHRSNFNYSYLTQNFNLLRKTSGIWASLLVFSTVSIKISNGIKSLKTLLVSTYRS